MVNTSKNSDRRNIQFTTIDALLAEIDRICEAEQAGTLRQTGKWTPGQIFGHLAGWIEYGYEGYPFKTPWFIRMILRSRVKKYVREGMPAGVRIPGVSAGTYSVEPLVTSDGAEKLRRALQRLKIGEKARFESPAFGAMSEGDRIALNLRHAELHIGYLHL